VGYAVRRQRVAEIISSHNLQYIAYCAHTKPDTHRVPLSPPPPAQRSGYVKTEKDPDIKLSTIPHPLVPLSYQKHPQRLGF
jgi:hypothetical protein